MGRVERGRHRGAVSYPWFIDPLNPILQWIVEVGCFGGNGSKNATQGKVFFNGGPFSRVCGGCVTGKCSMDDPLVLAYGNKAVVFERAKQ